MLARCITPQSGLSYRRQVMSSQAGSSFTLDEGHAGKNGLTQQQVDWRHARDAYGFKFSCSVGRVPLR